MTFFEFNKKFPTEKAGVDYFVAVRYGDTVVCPHFTFMNVYNPDQFTILGMDGNEYAEDLGIKEIGKEWCKIYKEQGGTGHMSPAMHSLVMILKNGKAKTIYKRILIKRKEKISK